MNQAFYRFVALALSVAALHAAIADAVGQVVESIDARTVRGLQQRRMFDLARLHAESVLEEPETSQTEQVKMAVLLIETLSQQAAATVGEERQAAWDLARQTAARLQARYREQPRGMLVDVQSILVNQSRIEQFVRETEIAAVSAERRSETQELAREVQREFDAILTRITELANRPRNAASADSLSPEELRTLRYHVEYQLARALMLAGLLYSDDDRASRVDVMERVESRLQPVLQSTSPDQVLWWNVQADRLAAARSVDGWERVAAIAAALPDSPPDAVTRDRMQAELILVRLGQRRIEDAARLAGTATTASAAPELDVARIRVYTAMAAGESANREQWQQRALDLTRDVELAHGSYWGRRAEMAVVGAARHGEAPGGNLELLIRVADDARRKQQWNEAIEALDAAFDQAIAEDNRNAAWQTGFAAAAIEQQRENFETASQRFANLAERLPQHESAASAQLMACWCLSRTLNNDAGRLQQYQTMLENLIQRWPTSGSADQARIWLASVRRAAREFQPAVTLLMTVHPESPLRAAAVEQIRHWLPEWAAAGETARPAFRDTIDAIATQLPTMVPEETTESVVTENRQATRWQSLVLLAELKWLFGAATIELEASTLATLESAATTAAQTNHARALQLVALACDDEVAAEFQALLESIEPDPDVLVTLRNGLTGSYRTKPPSESCHRALLAVAARFAESIGKLDQRQRYRWAVAQVQALAATKAPDALEIATKVAERYPRDATIQQLLGELLLARVETDSSQRPAALTQWRKLAAASPPHSELWYQAKLTVARLLSASEQRDEARRMLEYLKAVPPGWTESPLAPEFNRLLGELQ